MNNDHELLKSYLKDWTIERVLGQGSFGKVYEISRNDNGTIYRAALKVISIPQSNAEVEDLTKEGNTEDQVKSYLKGVVDDIKRENAIMSQLKGRTNIVSYEHHEVHPHEDGLGWDIVIRMELLTPLMDYLLGKESGEGHVQEIKYGSDKVMKLYENDIIKLGIDICHALEICNAKNIIHRDIKPENIFVNDDGDFKLGDFGIARSISEGTLSDMTRTGTPSYMAPEVYQNNLKYDKSVDTYSLGIVLYKLLNHNRLPFSPAYPAPVTAAAKVESVTRRVNGHELPKPDGCKNGDLIKTILKACSFKPEDRFKTPEDMRRSLESILRGETPDFLKEDLKKDDHNPFTDLTVNVTNTGSTIPEIHTYDDENGHDKKVKSKGTAKKLLFILIPVIAVIGIAATAFLFRPWESKEENPAANTNGPAENLPTEECKHENLEYIHISDKTYISALEYTQNRTPVCADCKTEFDNETATFEIPANKIDSCGECGDGVYWNLSKDGVLTVYGNGAMDENVGPEYKMPWHENRLKIKKAIFEQGVTYLPDLAFFGAENLTEVTLPETMSATGQSSFAFSGITTITIPASLTDIGRVSLSDCASLESINVDDDNTAYTSEDGVLYTKDMSVLIQYPAGKKAESYELPKTVKEIRQLAFDMSGLSSVKVEKGNNTYTSVDGVLMSKNKKVLVYYPGAKEGNAADGEQYIIPSHVEELGFCAFSELDNVKYVVVPDTVKKFSDEGTFNFHQSDASVVCNEGSAAYEHCNKMGIKYLYYPENSEQSIVPKKNDKPDSDIVIPYSQTTTASPSKGGNLGNGIVWILYNDGVLNISGDGHMPNYNYMESPFYNNTDIKSVVIDHGVKSIGENAFVNCSGIQTVSIPESVTVIKDGAFDFCKGLTSIRLPGSLTGITGEAFNYCSNLKNIEVDKDNKILSSIDGVLYNKKKTNLICYPAGKKGTYYIPNSVTHINEEAFNDCDDMTIVIPNTVKSLNRFTFCGCNNSTFVIPDSVIEINPYTFSSCDNTTIQCSAGSAAEAYAKSNSFKIEYIS